MGELNVRGIHLELRHALEPWHVMGEEGMAGTTVRLWIRRWSASRSGQRAERQPLCHHRQRPAAAAATHRPGGRIRGRRALPGVEPTLGAAPDRRRARAAGVDVIDTWSERSLGGCQYHVAHPGGRNYASFPVNAYEAESRRLARFFTTRPHRRLGDGQRARPAASIPSPSIYAASRVDFRPDLS